VLILLHRRLARGKAFLARSQPLAEGLLLLLLLLVKPVLLLQKLLVVLLLLQLLMLQGCNKTLQGSLLLLLLKQSPNQPLELHTRGTEETGWRHHRRTRHGRPRALKRRKRPVTPSHSCSAPIGIAGP